MAIQTESPLKPIYENFLSLIGRLKDRANEAITNTAAGNVDANAIVALYKNLTQVDGRLLDFTTITGLGQYAKDFENDQAYDLNAEIGVLRTAVVGVTTWIDDSFPKSDTYWKFFRTVDRVILPRVFSSAATAGMRTKLQDVIDAIE